MSDPHYSDSIESSNRNKPKLTLFVKRIIDAAWYINLVAIIVWPIFVLVVGVNIPSNIEQRHTDVHFYLNFKVLPDRFAQSAAEQISISEIMQGTGDIKLNNTKSSLAWYLAGGITEIMALIAMIALFYIRKLFANLAVNKTFDKDNARFIQNLGYVFIGSNLLFSILIYFGGLAILNDVGIHDQTIELSAAVHIDLSSILVGLAILILAGVMKEAAAIHEEQSLTI